MLALSSYLRYFIYCKPIDMRKGFDGLAGIVRNEMSQNPLDGGVYIFLNKSLTHIKLLYWDGDGFALFYKRLEKGRYAMPSHCGVSKPLAKDALLMLLEGLSIDNMIKKKRYKLQ